MPSSAALELTPTFSRAVLIFDNRGIGSSEIPKEHLRDGYTVQDMASDVVDLIKVRFPFFVDDSRSNLLSPPQHNGLREIDILGFSMVRTSPFFDCKRG